MLHIITPSRERVGNVIRLQRALRETCTGEWRLWLGIDSDDPMLDEYRALADEKLHTYVLDAPRQHLSGWTNRLAEMATWPHGANAEWLASLGDDHVPRTIGWDEKLIGAIQAMDGPGWAHGDDGHHRQNLPTAWVQSAQLVRALGWMMLPTAQHLFVDNAVKDLGTAAGRIAYLPGVNIEHLHAALGKAPEDQSYRDSNSQTRIQADRAAHQAWLRGPQFPADVTTVRSLTWEVLHGRPGG